MVLSAAEGRVNHLLVRELSTATTVLLWLKRYNAEVPGGLFADRPGSGRPRRISEDKEATIMEATIKAVSNRCDALERSRDGVQPKVSPATETPPLHLPAQVEFLETHEVIDGILPEMCEPITDALWRRDGIPTLHYLGSLFLMRISPQMRRLPIKYEEMTPDTRTSTADSISDPTWRITLDATSFAGRSREILDELRHGHGFVVLRGLTLDEFIQGCQHLGQIIPQTNAGGLFYSVRDEGLRIESDYGKPGVRTSKTNAGFEFHTDSPSRLAGHTPEFIALYVSQVAKSGGESALVNAYDVHEIIERERPDLLARLYEPYWVDRRAELPPGEEPIVPVPVFSRHDNGALTVRYLRLYIVKGHEQRGSRLEGPDLDALDFFESVMNRPGLPVTIPMERDEVQIINNRFILHSRTEFVDYPEPDRKRHYVRIWLNDI